MTRLEMLFQLVGLLKNESADRSVYFSCSVLLTAAPVDQSVVKSQVVESASDEQKIITLVSVFIW